MLAYSVRRKYEYRRNLPHYQKSESAHRINKVLLRTGRVWQDESFDHILRGNESLKEKVRYILENPVRAGLVKSPPDYPWLWWSPELVAAAS